MSLFFVGKTTHHFPQFEGLISAKLASGTKTGTSPLRLKDGNIKVPSGLVICVDIYPDWVKLYVGRERAGLLKL